MNWKTALLTSHHYTPASVTITRPDTADGAGCGGELPRAMSSPSRSRPRRTVLARTRTRLGGQKSRARGLLLRCSYTAPRCRVAYVYISHRDENARAGRVRDVKSNFELVTINSRLCQRVARRIWECVQIVTCSVCSAWSISSCLFYGGWRVPPASCVVSLFLSFSHGSYLAEDHDEYMHYRPVFFIL
uniref:Uncharacterized protein n=1 Tax=Trichogramma kaykai TaxID=54128 RepID=A0ABD2X2S1_9HYME